MTEANKKKVVICSEIAELSEIEYFLNNVFNEYFIDTKYFNKVFLCVSEAVVNSITHGNKLKRNKKVSVCVKHIYPFIKIKVCDQGSGFDYLSLQNPVDKENLKSETGRGIFIMKNYCEEVKFNKKGNSIYLSIRVNEGEN